MTQFEIRRTADGGYYWRLRAGNNETLCHSEAMTSKGAAQDGIAAVKRIAQHAPISDLT